MRRCITIGAAFAAILPSVTLPGVLQADAPAEPLVTVLETTGRVELREPGEAWRRASAGDRLPLGATISTGFGAAAVLEAGSAVLDIDPLTRMRIDELLQREGLERTELHLELGRVRAEVESVEGVQQEFQLTSPVSTAAVRGTSFSFDGYSLRVARGRVRLINRVGRGATVGADESSSSDGIADASNPADEAERAAAPSTYVGGPEPRETGAESPDSAAPAFSILNGETAVIIIE